MDSIDLLLEKISRLEQENYELEQENKHLSSCNEKLIQINTGLNNFVQHNFSIKWKIYNDK